MELPTYTNIWKIEKRLYKLYDFRLPMPLPIGQVAAFLAIAIPYMLILTLAGMPFSHTWVWLYVLPPGVLAWLVTRPVLEGKRLPELVLSQLRYLSEPRTWCRMAPFTEKDEITVVAKVWRRGTPAAGQGEKVSSALARPLEAPELLAPPEPEESVSDASVAAGDARERPAGPPRPDASAERPGDVVTAGDDRERLRGTAAAAHAGAITDSAGVPARPVWPSRPAISRHTPAANGPATASRRRAERTVAAAADPLAAADARAAVDARAIADPPAAAAGANWPAAASAVRAADAGQDALARPDPLVPASAETNVRARAGLAEPASAETPKPAASVAAPQAEPALPADPAFPADLVPPADLASPADLAPAAELTAPSAEERIRQPAGESSGTGPPARIQITSDQGRPVARPHRPAAPPQPPARPGLTVRTDGTTSRPLHVVERALRSSAPGTVPGWHDRVVVVPGGHRPGKLDQVQRDQARARLPLTGPARIVVLGCTAGAGQTVTTLLTGQLLASLRGEPVAVLDLSAGTGSLTEQARQIPRLLPARRDAADSGRGSEPPGSGRERGLHVITGADEAGEPGDAGQLIDAVAGRYPLMLADPSAGQVPRALQAADQLVLVAPASADAAGALAMTLEWLEAHGRAELARGAVTVLNGVSDETAAHVDKAAAVANGSCRAIVRVPWDGQLAAGGALGVASVQAYTALAGVLIAGLASPAQPQRKSGART